MAIKFTTTNKAAECIKCLVYGESGVGKTYLAKTAPSPLIISSEHRLLSLKDANIPVILVENHMDLQSAYSFVVSDPRAEKFKTIVIDSISDIAESILDYFKENPKDGNPHPQAAYGAMAEELVPMIKKFRDIPNKHIYVIAKAKRIKDDYSGVLSWSVSIPGRQVGPNLPYLFDFVLPMRIGEKPDGKKFRFLQTEKDIQYHAKECSGRLNPVEKPHLGQLFNKALGITTEEKEEVKEAEKVEISEKIEKIEKPEVKEEVKEENQNFEEDN